MNLQTLRALGFDHSAHVPFTREYRVRCSQCDACTINGVPCHETGCPHIMRECVGCDALIPKSGSNYCSECRS